MHLNNKLLDLHLKYTEQTEPPKMFHVWSVVSSIAACAGRHVWIETGLGETYLNIYTLLVGPPGTRKSTAMKYPMSIMESCTSVKKAPDDTSGQRQGLLAAMTDSQDDEADFSEDDLETIAALSEGKLKTDDIDPYNGAPDLPIDDKYVMSIFASEWGSFIGKNNLDLARFLIKMWDNEPYDYKLKTSRMRLKDANLCMIGCTTPTEITQLLPPEAIGGGFMSRIILVYSSRKYKDIPPSKVFLDKTTIPKMEEIYKWICYEAKGAIKLTQEASDYLDELYLSNIKMDDTRFMYYLERRATHLMKLAGLLCLGDLRTVMEKRDLHMAHELLSRTEITMPDALGEFGLSPVTVAKQKMIEFIKHARGPVTDTILWTVMQRDMKLLDYRNCLAELITAKKIVKLDTDHGTAWIDIEERNDQENLNLMEA